MVANFHNDERLERVRAVTAEINAVPLREVMETLFGFRGKKAGREMVKYEVSPGFYLNCSTAGNWFASFNGAPIPGLGGNGRKATGSVGAIDAVIAVRSILGGRCEFKEARAELQHAFLPHTLEEGYVGGSSARPVAAPSPQELESPKELPARFDRASEYLQVARTGKYEPLLKLPEDLAEHVLRYLTTTRKIPETVASGLMERNAVFPSVRERWLKSRHTGRPYLLAEPMVVFPLSSWRENIVVGYDYKTLPTEPAYASFAASEGRKKFGGYQVGRWDENTRHVVMTEGALDGISKWVLDRPGPDTCIWAMSGARTSEILIDECRKRGIDVRAAFDNDPAGRFAAGATMNMCREYCVHCSCEFVHPSEIDFALKNDDAGVARLRSLTALCHEHGLLHHFEEPEDGFLHGVVSNHGAAVELLTGFLKGDQIDRMTAEARGDQTPAAEPRVFLEFRNKDWNDALKNDFKPKLAPELEVEAQVPAGERSGPEPTP
jgi:hypothetical protein